jgi:hypothetical protein
MAYDQDLANKILLAADRAYPDAISGFSDLQLALGFAAKAWDDDWRLALEALLAQGLVTIDNPTRTGRDQVLRGFVGLRITQLGRNAAKRIA